MPFYLFLYVLLQRSSFSVFGEPTIKGLSLQNGGGHIVSRPNGFGIMGSPKMVGWASAVGTASSTTGGVPSSNKTGSLNICSQDMKKVWWNINIYEQFSRNVMHLYITKSSEV